MAKEDIKAPEPVTAIEPVAAAPVVTPVVVVAPVGSLVAGPVASAVAVGGVEIGTKPGKVVIAGGLTVTTF